MVSRRSGVTRARARHGSRHRRRTCAQESKFGIPLCHCCQLAAWGRGRDVWRRKVEASERLETQFHAIFSDSVAHAKQGKAQKRKQGKAASRRHGGAEASEMLSAAPTGTARRAAAGDGASDPGQLTRNGAVANIMADLGMAQAAAKPARPRASGASSQRMTVNTDHGAGAAAVLARKAKKPRANERKVDGDVGSAARREAKRQRRAAVKEAAG